MITIVVFALASIASNESESANMCLPGAQLECACPGGGRGAQVCREDGQGVGSCLCPVQQPDLGPRELEDRGAVLTGYTRQERVRTEYVVGGLGTLTGLYLLSGLVATTIDADGTSKTSHRWLYVPAIGPFIAAASPEPDRQDRYTWLLVVDGLVQTAGAAIALYGLLSPESYLVRNDLIIAPVASQDGAGLALSGRF